MLTTEWVWSSSGNDQAICAFAFTSVQESWLQMNIKLAMKQDCEPRAQKSNLRRCFWQGWRRDRQAFEVCYGRHWRFSSLTCFVSKAKFDLCVEWTNNPPRISFPWKKGGDQQLLEISPQINEVWSILAGAPSFYSEVIWVDYGPQVQPENNQWQSFTIHKRDMLTSTDTIFENGHQNFNISAVMCNIFQYISFK